MAKKAAKKAGKDKAGGKKSVKGSAKRAAKPAKKSGGKPKAAAKAKSAIPAENPSKVSTGSGPSPAEIGADLVAMFNRGELPQIEEKYWSAGVVSVEGSGMNMAWHGREAVVGKNQWWMQDHAIRSASAEGPYVGASGFAVKFVMDVETKSTGTVEAMTEVGVYTVQNGKIAREEFMGLVK